MSDRGGGRSRNGRSSPAILSVLPGDPRFAPACNLCGSLCAFSGTVWFCPNHDCPINEDVKRQRVS